MSIRVLDKNIAELIAAGEVVERPSAIVKELVENSIDAGATNISVEISGGGVRMIRITDNGCGISREDIPLAFLRHATSKVCKAEDLDGILTLGFRGEALASVAAMCRVELTTRAANENEGTLYRIEGGKVNGCVPAGRPVGTTVTVRDVFFNTPARMKFLKKDVTEGNSVAQTVDKCALSHPEIAFTFIRDGAIKLKTSGGGELLAAVYAIHGRELAKELLEVDYVYEKFARVSGFISRPGCSKPTRAYQNFFINGRFVKTRTASAALEEAFKGKLMAGKFPSCFLHLELDAALVDVNVHPAKTEVRFADERPVFSCVYYAVKSALSKLEALPGQNGAASPEARSAVSAGWRALYAPKADDAGIQLEYKPIASGGSLSSRAISMGSSSMASYRLADSAVKTAELPANSVKNTVTANDKIYADNAINTPINATTSLGASAISDTEAKKPPNLRLIGEVFGTYIVLENEDELILVDKHAAHERMLYERLKAGVKEGCRQVLLTCQSVALSREEHAALLENADKLEELGFLAEDFGGSSVVIREVPIELSECDVEFIIRELAAKLASGSFDLTPTALDRLYHSIACRSAIKAGDKNSDAELYDIVKRLRENPELTHCPHGRPVTVKISRRELEKMFGRLG